MKKGWIAAGAAVGILIALLSVLLPVGKLLGTYRETRQLIRGLETRVGEMPPTRRAKEWSLAQWYNLTPGQQGSYDGILNLYQGVMGVLELPEGEYPITHGAVPLPGRAGHDPVSALPLGTAGSHTVLYLREAPALKPGEVVRVRCLDSVIFFRVESVQVMPTGWSTDMLCLDRKGYLTLAVDKNGTRTLIRCGKITENR